MSMPMALAAIGHGRGLIGGLSYGPDRALAMPLKDPRLWFIVGP
jgi:hypothetical protein